MILGIVGSRDYNDYNTFCTIVDNYLDGRKPQKIISGGCTGVDTLAERYAKDHGIQIQVFSADWKTHGRAAGPLRNTQIVNEITDLLALPTSKSVGTHDTIIKAKRKLRESHIVVKYV